MRLASALFAAVAAFFAALFARELVPSAPWAWAAGGMVAAFQPMLGFMSGGVNNDSLLFAASAVLLYAVARALRRGLDVAAGRAGRRGDRGRRAHARRRWSRCCRSPAWGSASRRGAATGAARACRGVPLATFAVVAATPRARLLGRQCGRLGPRRPTRVGVGSIGTSAQRRRRRGRRSSAARARARGPAAGPAAVDASGSCSATRGSSTCRGCAFMNDQFGDRPAVWNGSGSRAGSDASAGRTPSSPRTSTRARCMSGSARCSWPPRRSGGDATRSGGAGARS